MKARLLEFDVPFPSAVKCIAPSQLCHCVPPPRKRLGSNRQTVILEGHDQLCSLETRKEAMKLNVNKILEKNQARPGASGKLAV